MAENRGCDSCHLRAKYDGNPESFLGRIWRWHINWCPGWKKFFNSLPDEKKAEVAKTYNFKKYQ
ncbi:MAG: hypothetical protein KJ970_04105 [Candidatus Eisenbacteria bacterium]|uniref:Uncharacterized protein n=1 Tax=Eiseniibacteriota bacterium TaxID=2212470 RepID=A0A948RW46_UNCEI|nr:hypothetical protein [Candidatus Eisenbacteria bacterium]MBU1950421.1 hypothetical protein [Candidatus Eisenbacteria bacterium]MBU2690087.1 hypothetical protein [Candidatus Eisenbacteria bacterium]